MSWLRTLHVSCRNVNSDGMCVSCCSVQVQVPLVPLVLGVVGLKAPVAAVAFSASQL